MATKLKACDWFQVLEIDQLCHRHPWTLKQLVDYYRHGAAINATYVDGLLCGYILFVSQPAAIQVVRLAVHPSCWRRGHGSLLLDSAKWKLSSERPVVEVRISEWELEAHRFLKASGFLFDFAERATHEPRGEDAYVFVYEMAKPAKVLSGE